MLRLQPHIFSKVSYNSLIINQFDISLPVSRDTLLRHGRSHNQVLQDSSEETGEGLHLSQHQDRHPPEILALSTPNSPVMDSSSALDSVSFKEWSDRLSLAGLDFATAPGSLDMPLGANGCQQQVSQQHGDSQVNPLWHELDSLLDYYVDCGGLNTLLAYPENMETLSEVIHWDTTRNTPLTSSVPGSVNPDSSTQIASSPRQDQVCLDENCHRNLMDKLQSQQGLAVLPSTPFLVGDTLFLPQRWLLKEQQEICMRAYLCHFHPHFPIIHAPTFKLRSRNEFLLVSILSMGCLFVGSPRATEQGISMFERLHKAMLSKVHSNQPAYYYLSSANAYRVGHDAFRFWTR
jgi:hypothetical protein